jgi:hypothetical protein
VRLLRILERLSRVFHRLAGEFVRGQVICFVVMYSSAAVRMCRQFVKLSGSLVSIVRHGVSFQKTSLWRYSWAEVDSNFGVMLECHSA